ncbi:MAG: polyprenyl synthetase family protein [Rickettsiales bacterium]|jgi:geranylgeranyl pyrophosphate synthase|nr:polyprenyl synthetase family protein [Rickettsiales bacterium]
MPFLGELAAYKKKIDALVDGGWLKEKLDSYCRTPFADVFVEHTRGGKRLRAFLVSLGWRIAGGRADDARILRASVSVEVFQTGILAQDDVIDKSGMRRGRPSVHKALGGDWNAVSKTICLGDFAISVAGNFIMDEDFEPLARLNAVRRQADCFSGTIAGELDDICLSAAGDFTLEQVLDMERRKTSLYTMSGPLAIGAALGGAPGALISMLEEFGENAGLAFQIMDDIEGVFGDEKAIGKPTLCDAREGKKTLLSWWFLRRAGDKEKGEFAALYGNESLGYGGLERVKELLVDSGALEYARGMAAKYAAKARQCAMKIPREQELLVGLADYLSAGGAGPAYSSSSASSSPLSSSSSSSSSSPSPSSPPSSSSSSS